MTFWVTVHARRKSFKRDGNRFRVCFILVRHTHRSKVNIVRRSTRWRIVGTGVQRGEENHPSSLSFVSFTLLSSPLQNSYPCGAEYGVVALRGRRVHRLQQTFVSKIKTLDSGARDRPLENVNNNKRKK